MDLRIATALERAAAIKTLKDRRLELPQTRQEFAASLVDQSASKRGLSDKQWYWVGVLIEQLDAPKPKMEQTEVADMAKVVSLFDKAATKLKAAAVVLVLDGAYVRLSVAGERARVPGSINVVVNNEWLGRILRTGVLEKSLRCETLPDGLVELIKRFADEPAKVAAEFGRLTGRCCFCGTELTDEKSTAAGFGPTCAKNYGLGAEWKAAQALLKCEAA